MKRRICYCTVCLVAMALVFANGAPGAPKSEQQTDKSKPAAEAENDKKKEEPAAQPEKKAEDAKTAAKPTTATVERGLLKIEVSLSGVLEAKQMTPVVLKPKAWSTLKVLSAVEHGSVVKRGDLLVTLDLEPIDRGIADLRKAHAMSDLEITLAEDKLALLKKTTPMDLAAGKRGQRKSHEDLDYYKKTGRPLSVKSAEFSRKSAEQYAEYQREELRQLEKMYAADDLTEETEEIILKRARNNLEYAEYSLERSIASSERSLKVTIPRLDVSNELAAKRYDLQWESTRVALPLALKKARMELEKVKITRSRSEEKLKKLLADRAAMLVKAPASGVVYYGKCVRGKFSTSTTTTASLRNGGSLTANDIFMTIVKPRPVFVRATVAESLLHNVRAGIKGTVTPTAYPDKKLTAIVESVSAIPISSGSFGSKITVAVDRNDEALMPGMNCKAKLISYLNEEALTIPPKSVFSEELDEAKKYVYLVGKDGEPKKQPVTVGRKTVKKIEILKGLSEGDKVLQTKPNGDPEEEKEDKEEKKEKSDDKK